MFLSSVDLYSVMRNVSSRGGSGEGCTSISARKRTDATTQRRIRVISVIADDAPSGALSARFLWFYGLTFRGIAKRRRRTKHVGKRIEAALKSGVTASTFVAICATTDRRPNADAAFPGTLSRFHGILVSVFTCAAGSIFNRISHRVLKAALLYRRIDPRDDAFRMGTITRLDASPIRGKFAHRAQDYRITLDFPSPALPHDRPPSPSSWADPRTSFRTACNPVRPYNLKFRDDYIDYDRLTIFKKCKNESLVCKISQNHAIEIA